MRRIKASQDNKGKGARRLKGKTANSRKMVTTTRDFFSIQGARETHEEVKRAYRAFGKEDNFGMVEDDYTHGYTQKNREATYAFFQKYLNLPGSSADEEVE